MVLRNNNLNNNFRCSIFFVPVIPGLCPSVPRGWGTLGQSTMGYNFWSSAEIVHGVKSLMYWPCTQRHWWSLCRILNTSVKYLGSKRKVYEKRPSLPRFPLLYVWICNTKAILPLVACPIHNPFARTSTIIIVVASNKWLQITTDLVSGSGVKH